MSAEAQLFEREWSARISSAPSEHALTGAKSQRIAADVSTAALIGAFGTTFDQGFDEDAAWAELSSVISVVTPMRRVSRAVRPVQAKSHRRAYLVAASGVAAACVAIAGVSMQTSPGNPLYGLRRGVESTVVFVQPNNPDLHERLAVARVKDLAHVLNSGKGGAVELAESVVRERSEAVSNGGDSAAASRIDTKIAEEIAPALAEAEPAEVEEVQAVLAAIAPPEEPSDTTTDDTTGADPGAEDGTSEDGTGGGGSNDASQDSGGGNGGNGGDGSGGGGNGGDGNGGGGNNAQDSGSSNDTKDGGNGGGGNGGGGNGGNKNDNDDKKSGNNDNSDGYRTGPPE